ncbi:FecR domain-containing protein [Myxococcota bacterium]|nr:FecR domain-containing protein [Myxococcota bacterium]
MNPKASTLFAVAVALALAGTDARAGGPAPAGVSVTLVQGKAEVERAGKRSPLAVGAAIAEGDTVETSARTKVELTLADGSRVRLAPNTKVTLTEGKFRGNEGRNVRVGLVAGQVWAKVAKAVGGKDTFEVGTENAVAGVRGTAFAVSAAADLSAVVRVYAGTVGVRKSEKDAGATGGKPERRQIAGPERIDKKQWEEIIATAMKQVKISSTGQIAPAEDFEDRGEDLEWAMWNKERDAQ